ncbi:MAG: DUF3050 domain-containing protein [Planctomycetota bacterium]|nr:DUF3050 domain-containing protein [Planctomycetota bacterium]
MKNPGLSGLRAELAPLRARLVAHPLYGSLKTLDQVRTFQEHHVFAVWDFMSLLKALQRELTCVEVPWRPAGDPIARRLINEIVVAEESDDDGRGGYLSHFDLYLASMLESGASTHAIRAVLERLEGRESLEHALEAAPAAARAFCGTTFEIAGSGSIPAIAAAFTLGREDVIPDMFRQIVRDLDRSGGPRLPSLVDYLERHVALDGERHGPMAERMLASLCGDDASAWRAALEAAEASIRARIGLWDAIQDLVARPRRAVHA